MRLFGRTSWMRVEVTFRADAAKAVEFCLRYVSVPGFDCGGFRSSGRSCSRRVVPVRLFKARVT